MYIYIYIYIVYIHTHTHRNTVQQARAAAGLLGAMAARAAAAAAALLMAWPAASQDAAMSEMRCTSGISRIRFIQSGALFLECSLFLVVWRFFESRDVFTLPSNSFLGIPYRRSTAATTGSSRSGRRSSASSAASRRHAHI